MLLTITAHQSYAQVSINVDGNIPDASAMLDVQSTERGFLAPRMTMLQRDAIASPVTGLLVFQTDSTAGFYYFDGTAWGKVSNGASSIDELSDGKTGGNSVFLGLGAGSSDDGTANRNVAVGDAALQENTTGSYNTANGYHSLNGNTEGGNNTASGYQSLNRNITGNHNAARGHRSLYENTFGLKNTASGSYSLYRNTVGDNNVASGYNSLRLNISGNSNVAIGIAALYSNTYRDNLVAIGDSALFNNGIGAVYPYDGAYNTAVGSKALFYNTTGYQNTATGLNSLRFNTSGFRNAAFGFASLYSNSTGMQNTAFGTKCLIDNQTGYNNTAIGFESFNTGTDYYNSTALGYNAEPHGSNTVRIGNGNVSTIGGYANWTNVSDKRFKTNVRENVAGLDFIMKLRPVTYNLDMDAIARFYSTPDNLRLPQGEQLKAAELQTGFIAQEVETAANSVGYDFHGVDKPKNENSHYGLRYAEFVVPLVKATQEHQEVIENLEKENTALKEQIDKQNNQMVNILKRINKLENK